MVLGLGQCCRPSGGPNNKYNNTHNKPTANGTSSARQSIATETGTTNCRLSHAIVCKAGGVPLSHPLPSTIPILHLPLAIVHLQHQVMLFRDTVLVL